MNDETTRPLFIVGTSQEVGYAYRAGHEAVAIQGMDAGEITNLVLRIARENRTAIVLLDSGKSYEVEEACYKAGAAVQVVAPNRRNALTDIWTGAQDGYSQYKEVLDLEAREAIENQAKRLDEAKRRMLERMGVHDSFTTITELTAGQADREKIRTGINSLDSILDGGLPSGGLVTIGALSSAGKTTLCNQIGDNVARAGRHVLFVTCEQSRYELTSMSLSRIMRCTPTRNGGHYTATRAAIQSAVKRESWGEPLRRAYDTACNDYQMNIAPRMHIMETDEQPTARDIRRAAEAVRDTQGGTSPFVIVDYLQLLRAENERKEERLAINDSVSTLRKLARDLDTCVVLISALNRYSISEGVTQSAFRESSGIEYSSDLMLGLQPRNMTSDLQGVGGEKQQRSKANEIIDNFRDQDVKDCEIRILKNRAGIVPKDGVPLKFEGASSYFYPDTSDNSAASVGKPNNTHGLKKW